uniref:Uncharacterized protein n=1 Tax=Candidatus Kentrum sp. LPFa TaxID=2126335 RepID=A0A450WIM0_9GAMM|nr:MAG: hypothetical protein BECKLPF1236B_GA0070989_110410 [Candidatus Kentron sp. LPFa]
MDCAELSKEIIDFGCADRETSDIDNAIGKHFGPVIKNQGFVMLENDILEQWLSDEAKRVLARLKADEPLTQDDKLIIVLKGQMNHFHHLDVELRQEVARVRTDLHEEIIQVRTDLHQEIVQVRTDLHQEIAHVHADLHREITRLRTDTDRRFEKVDQRFEKVDERFEQLRADMNRRLEQLYQTVNTQTWKMIGAVGLIVVLGKLIEQI